MTITGWLFITQNLWWCNYQRDNVTRCHKQRLPRHYLQRWQPARCCQPRDCPVTSNAITGVFDVDDAHARNVGLQQRLHLLSIHVRRHVCETITTRIVVRIQIRIRGHQPLRNEQIVVYTSLLPALELETGDCASWVSDIMVRGLELVCIPQCLEKRCVFYIVIYVCWQLKIALTLSP